VGGSIEKAAFAIELALKPELNHPSPLPLHGIRGFIYYSWASEILRGMCLDESILSSFLPLSTQILHSNPAFHSQFL
jgi:hypothetical protein